MKDKKGRRLNAEDRMSIQACIHCKMGISQIAARTGFSKSAISREIKNNSIRKPGMDAPCRKRVAGVCNCCPTRAFCHRAKAFYDFAEAEGRSRALMGRTYRDYLARVKARPRENVAQYDSVIGKATDKAECERLHELVRYCLPKGRSLDSLTQEAVDEMYSDINSYVRKSQGDQTPYDKVRRKFGDGFLAKIGIRRVPKKKVRLLPIV